MAATAYLVRRGIRGLGAVVVGALTLGGGLAGGQKPVEKGLLIDVATGQNTLDGLNAGQVRSRTARIDLAQVAAAEPGRVPMSIHFNLFVDVSLWATRVDLEWRGPFRYTWVGKVEDDPQGQVVLVANNGRVNASIFFRGAWYGLRSMDGTLHEISVLNVTDIQEPVFEGPKLGASCENPDSCVDVPAGDDGSQIDVLFLYTPAADEATGDVEGEIRMAAAMANRAFGNSNVQTRVRAVGILPIQYEESHDIETDLLRLRTSSGGLERVATLRNVFMADVVSLWIEDGGTNPDRGRPNCGLAESLKKPAHPRDGFHVVRRDCAGGNVFAHELGHNLGASHDQEQLEAEGRDAHFCAGRGWVAPDDSFRTIMSYRESCDGCLRIPFFSSPNVTWNGEPIGSETADNVRLFSETACRVGQYRESREHFAFCGHFPKFEPEANPGYEEKPLGWIDGEQFRYRIRFEPNNRNLATIHVEIRPLGSSVFLNRGSIRVFEGDSSSSVVLYSDLELMSEIGSHIEYGPGADEVEFWFYPGSRSNWRLRLKHWEHLIGVADLFWEIDAVCRDPRNRYIVVDSGADGVISGEEGGPFAPSTESYSVSNVGSYPLGFGVTVDYWDPQFSPWLSVGPSVGNLNPGESMEVVANALPSANSLPPGRYVAHIHFFNLSGGGGDESRQVTLEVGPAAQSTFTIAGRVSTPSGIPIEGVRILGLPIDKTTDVNGEFQVAGETGFSYTATPRKAGYDFDPPSYPYDRDHYQEFQGVAQSFTIAGSVRRNEIGVAGVVMNGLPGNPVTDDDGQYAVSNIPYRWTGTVTPQKAGHTFTPPTREYVSFQFSEVEENYSAALETVQVSGRVANGLGGFPGVWMSGLPGAVYTDDQGYYSATVPYGWEGVVTPTLYGYRFTPASASYPPLESSPPPQDYIPSAQGVTNQIFIVSTSAEFRHANQISRSGDFILVKPGTYSNVDLSAIDANVTVRSEAGPAATTVELGGSFVIIHPGVRVDGFTFQNSTNSYLLYIANTQNVVVKNCRFLANSSEEAVRISNAAAVTLEQNDFVTGSFGLLVRSGTASGAVTLRNNRFTTTSWAVTAASNPGIDYVFENNRFMTGGVEIDGARSALFSNNIFEGAGVAIEPNLRGVVATQNVFFGNSVAIDVSSSSAIEIYNSIFLNCGRAVDGGTGTVTIHDVIYQGGWIYGGPTYILDPATIRNLDPEFVDPTNGDFRLGNTSPALGSGQNGYDLGAYGGPRGTLWTDPPGIPEPAPELIELEILGGDQAIPGQTLALVARGAFSGGYTGVYTPYAEWSSSNLAVLQPLQPGSFQAVAPGVAIVTADGVTATAQREVTVLASHITIDAIDIPNPLPRDGQLTYFFNIGNDGGGPAQGSHLSLSYDPALSFVGASPNPDPGSENAWTLGDIPPGETVLVQVTVVLSAAAPSSVTSTATVEYNFGDPTMKSVLTPVEPEPVTCYPLNLSHTGLGADPVASPLGSPGCPSGQYQAGEVISLDASPGPDAGWTLGLCCDSGCGGWSGTDLDSSRSEQNQVTMPASGHTVTVAYVQECEAPVYIELIGFQAHSDGDGVDLQWETGYEIHNRGFYVYREDAAGTRRITPGLVAGSALLTGSVLTQGYSYSWRDATGGPDSVYWLEDVDLDGSRTRYGPFAVRTDAAPSQGKNSPALSPLLSQVGRGGLASVSPTEPSEWPLSSEPDREARLATRSRLAASPAAKIQVRREGLYRIDPIQLVEAGISPDAFAPGLRLFAEGVELPLLVVGEEDGRLDADDFLVFYGLGQDSPWSDARTYWLLESEQPGLRMETFSIRGADGPASFAETIQWKPRTTYFAALINGDQENFFGPTVGDEPLLQTFDIPFLDPSSSMPGRLAVELQGVVGPHDVTVAVNGTEIGRLAYTGRARGTAEFELPAGTLRPGGNEVRLVATEGGQDVSLVDRVLLTYPRLLRTSTDRLAMEIPGGSRVAVGGFGQASILAVDATDPARPFLVEASPEASAGAFTVWISAAGQGDRRILVSTFDALQEPDSVRANRPSHWSDQQSGAEVVMLTHREAGDEIARLRDFRQSQGRSVLLVDVEDLYDEYGDGSPTPFAIRDFLREADRRWAVKPRFLLLAGDASLDPKDYLGYGRRDSVPTRMLPSGFAETASDDWFADLDDDGLADLAVGRLPVQSREEAAAVVDKIIGYETDPPPGAWRSGVTLVSDRQGDFEFDLESRKLRALIPPVRNVLEISRGDDDAPSRLLRAIAGGQSLIGYLGHGSVQRWAGGLLDAGQAARLRNGGRLPFVVSMACLTGLFNGQRQSLAEALLTAPDGGAVAALASPSLDGARQQVDFAEAVFGRLFAQPALPLGEAVRQAKRQPGVPESVSNYVFFGDPLTRLVDPNPTPPASWRPRD